MSKKGSDKFAVGDRVRVVKWRKGYWSGILGCLGRVDACYGDYVYVLLDGDYVKSSYYAEDLEMENGI